MSKYCCFYCPKEDFSEKSEDQTCPDCGRAYSFPLKNHPSQVREYSILRALGRGFYGATYVAERGGEMLRKKYVLKISPVGLYEYFSKGAFKDEVTEHSRLAEQALHVVGIHGAFQDSVTFSDGSTLECYISILDYIDGDLLRDYISGLLPISAGSLCQIAIDLLALRAELENSQLNHNDLHLENLIVEKLIPEKRRADAIDPYLRVKAIDLGSLADESKSSDTRIGDIAFIASHVGTLTAKLIADPQSADDRDFRIALALQGIVQSMQTDPQNSRLPNPADLIEQIRYAFFKATHQWHPWREQLTLKSFADHYNAQTLESWHVPSLLVDPESRWHSEVTRPGPQIITGMRGCGKTILLRALDIHARAAHKGAESPEDILERIKGDRFVGLFLSSQRLLDLKVHSLMRIENRLTRLFVGYSLQAIRALIHLKDISLSSISPGAHATLGNAIGGYLEPKQNLGDVVSLEDLEQRLLKLLVLIIGPADDTQILVREGAGEIFNHLAEQFRQCSPIFSSSTVFFLLDDVSTRYVAIDTIEQLFSSLLFQSPICAFKFTSEWQTIELGLRSPGRIHPVRIDRDLTVFDLGADVLEKITAPGGGGKAFVSDILLQRTHLLASSFSHKDPKEILGDVPLEQIAKGIAAASASSNEKKRLYQGLSCLASVCVGDIGDVIKIYEEILRRGSSSAVFPIPPEIQSHCFMTMSVRRLYDLNRRAHQFKTHALAFAEVSHDLLVRSGRSGGKEARLRQYSSIYVRVTSDDEAETKAQIDQLRELIDAGVFVFAGGGPRTKTKDSNPIQQFILTFRKIYGLTAYMGLADRDRFELSGDDLRDWLLKPDKELLLKNQIKKETELSLNIPSGYSKGEDIELDTQKKKAPSKLRQADLFGISIKKDEVSVDFRSIDSLLDVRELSDEEVSCLSPNIVYTGLGFEERTLASNKYLAERLKAKSVYAIKYSSLGFAAEIIEAWQNSGASLTELSYQSALRNFVEGDNMLIDISGLTKPLIFNAICNQLKRKSRVYVCHSAAKFNYPLPEDLEPLFAAQAQMDPVSILESLEQVLRGEQGPYKDMRLLRDQSDPTRPLSLVGFASPKHERLFSLLDRREYNRLEIIVPSGSSPRSRVAEAAAKLIEQNYCNTRLLYSASGDLAENMNLLDKCFLDCYSGGSNVEFGLTGSKIHAVAAAAVSAVRKVSQVWYLQPKEFDESRFSTGVDAIRVFEIWRK